MKLFCLLLILATSSYAQYGGNKTFYEIINTAKEGVEAVNHLANSINKTIALVPDVTNKLKAIEDRMKSIEDSLNSIASPSYIVGVAAAVVTVSVLIGATFVGTRHMINRYNLFGAAEPYQSPQTNLNSFGREFDSRTPGST